MPENPNHCIRCNVESCENHCANECYCSLKTIEIGTHEAHPKMVECTDCKSFVKKTEF